MKKVMALKKCTEPSTGSTIHATQVVELSDEDADALIADKSAAETDEPTTSDVGALIRKEG